MAESKADIDAFIHVSQVLTGAAKLDPGLAEAYLGRLRAEYPAQVATMLKVFAAIDEHLVFEVKRRLVDDKGDMGKLTQKVIFIWYTSEFIGADGKPKAGTQDQFYSGLLWSVIRAHAPTNSKLNYGDWAKHP